MSYLPRITKFDVTASHCVALNFDDGTSGIWQADLDEFFGPIGEPLRDPVYFARVFIENGALVWPNGFDASPVALYQDLKMLGKLVPNMAAA